MESLKLIDGKFSAEEAKEILMTLASNKINFHALKDFSSQERTGEPATSSRQRIKELRETKERIVSLTEKARKENLTLKIESFVNITLIPKE